MARSILCSACKLEKEPGRDNESYCKKCKLARIKARRLAKMEAEGIKPRPQGRSPNCYECGVIKENPKLAHCYVCKRKKDNEWRLSTGRTLKHQTGLCPCGAPRASYNPAYCVDCASRQRQNWLDAHSDKKKEYLERSVKWKREHYISTSKGRIRRKGTLINGVPVNCPVCDKLESGWCDNCDLIYWWKKELYHYDPLYADRSRARALTNSYIKSGKLIKQHCEVCNEIKVEAHHDDYSKPLDIRWLCSKHHAEHHKNTKT